MKPTRAIPLGLIVLSALASGWMGGVNSADATPISLTNSSFETPALSDGGSTTSALGWVLSGSNSSYIGTMNPSSTEYTTAGGSGTPTGADGTNALFTYSANGTYQYARQDTSATFAANKLYTISGAVGHRNNRDLPFSVTMSIRYGVTETGAGGNYGTNVGQWDSTNPSGVLPANQFTTVTASYMASPGDSSLGKTVQVIFGMSSNVNAPRSADFDNIRLTVQDRSTISLSNPLSATIITGGSANLGGTLTNADWDSDGAADLTYSITHDSPSGVTFNGGTLLSGTLSTTSSQVAAFTQNVSSSTVGVHNATFTANGHNATTTLAGNNVTTTTDWAALSDGATQAATLTVLDHSDAAFANVSGAAMGTPGSNTLALDFGTVPLGAGGGALGSLFDVVAQASGYGAASTAGLDLDLIDSGSGDVSKLFQQSGLATFTNLAADSTSAYEFRLDTTAAGTFSATYQFKFSDQDLPGASTPQSEVLTLTLRGVVVVPEPSTFAMLLFGGLMMWVVGKKRR